LYLLLVRSYFGTSVKKLPGTPAGDYTLVYQISEIKPYNCDSATVM
jgi:hypothetical protein